MNSSTTRFSLSPHSTYARARFSPLLPRTVASRLATRRSVTPSSASLTPRTPTLSPFGWNPHLLDRLQAPLSRIRE